MEVCNEGISNYKDPEPGEYQADRIVKYLSLGEFTNLVPVFLGWQRFSFVPKRMVPKLMISKFIKELIYH